MILRDLQYQAATQCSYDMEHLKFPAYLCCAAVGDLSYIFDSHIHTDFYIFLEV